MYWNLGTKKKKKVALKIITEDSCFQDLETETLGCLVKLPVLGVAHHDAQNCALSPNTLLH